MDSDHATAPLDDLVAALKRLEETDEKPVWVVDLVSRRIVRRRTPVAAAAQPVAGGR